MSTFKDDYKKYVQEIECDKEKQDLLKEKIESLEYKKTRAKKRKLKTIALCCMSLFVLGGLVSVFHIENASLTKVYSKEFETVVLKFKDEKYYIYDLGIDNIGIDNLIDECIYKKRREKIYTMKNYDKNKSLLYIDKDNNNYFLINISNLNSLNTLLDSLIGNNKISDCNVITWNDYSMSSVDSMNYIDEFIKEIPSINYTRGIYPLCVREYKNIKWKIVLDNYVFFNLSIRSYNEKKYIGVNNIAIFFETTESKVLDKLYLQIENRVE